MNDNFRMALVCQRWALLALILCPSISFAERKPQTPVQSDVYVAGADNVHTYRIPAMIVPPNGMLLVFCEATTARPARASTPGFSTAATTQKPGSWGSRFLSSSTNARSWSWRTAD